jgi:hypothetical protein
MGIIIFISVDANNGDVVSALELAGDLAMDVTGPGDLSTNSETPSAAFGCNRIECRTADDADTRG